MEETQSEQATIKKNTWVFPVLAVMLVAGGIMFYSNNKSEPVMTIIEKTSSPSLNNESLSQTISVEGGNFFFKPNVIQVKKGETVKITFTNKDGFHDFVLEDFNVQTKQIKSGESETIEFTPTESGEFEFYCSVGNHKAQGMVGKLIVRD